MKRTNDLTKKERLFCALTARSNDAPAAAREAGYREPYAQKAAALLGRTEIGTEIDAQRRALQKESTAIALSALLRLCAPESGREHAALETGADGGGLLSAIDLFAVSEIKVQKGGGVEVKFVDRLKSVELLLEFGRDAAKDKEGGAFYKALNEAAARLYDRAQDERCHEV